MAEPNLIYKVSVLCLLSKSSSLLTNAQIAQFFLDKQYTGYFHIQQILSDLEESEFITSSVTVGNTKYAITETGKQTFEVMRDKLTEGIEQDIEDYLKQIHVEIRVDNAVTATYDRDVSGGYIVHLRFEQNGRKILNLDLHAVSEEQAERICLNWKARSMDVYDAVIDTLM